ncbi:MAG: DNA polymerase Y family protein [Rhodospirillales bacterium]|nr:DNA polymerase Y family protein [Rhodospirillales bacterium]
MKRVVSLFLPTWPTDRLRRAMGATALPPEVPLVLIGRDGRRRIVWAADAAAQRLGLRPGMAATQAHALVPGLQTHDAQPAADDAALDRLAVWALKHYSPAVAADPPDGLVIDASGAAHLKGGEAAMLVDLTERLMTVGVRAQAAMAGSHGAAHALARYRASPTLVVADGATGAAIADLPIAALRLPPHLVAGLKRMGFERIGELEAQPRAPLALRFGPEVGRRLDQAFGRCFEPITPIAAPELIQVRRNFAEPIGAAETIARYVGLLVVDLCTALENRSLGARRLDLLCHRVDNRIEAVRIGTARPLRDIKRLTRLLGDRIETIEPGFGIELMTLSAPIAEPLDYRPAATSLSEVVLPDVAGLIDTLANRVGADRLYRFAAVESDVPERSIRKVAPLAGPTGDRWPPHWPRPTRLLSPPEAIETMALLPDHPPVHFTWRGMRRRVKRADGPERIYGAWGRRGAGLSALRAEVQVEDAAGERFWLFRTGNGEDPATGLHRWFLHGVFG